jgi:hypothetical protein
MRLRGRQRGQSLVIGLFMLMIGALALFFQFSSGQVSADKQRVTNTADAAAYSAALWRARVLNYHAYSNRAMIANEVAIAQTLTLLSETQYLKNLAACLAFEAGDGDYMCSSAAPTILAIFGLSSYFSGAREILEYYQRLLQPTATAEIFTRSQVINRGLSASQELLHGSANSFVLQAVVARQVTVANDDNFTVRVVPDSFAGGLGASFTQRYSGERRDRIANIVRARLDPYTRDRRFTVPPLPCTPIPLIVLRKRGTTELSADLDRWEASDNLSEWREQLTIKGCRRNEGAISWASQSADGGSMEMRGAEINRNRRSRGYSRDDDVNYDHSNSYAGIQSFRDLNYSALSGGSDAQVRNPVHKLALVVRQPGSVVRTANTLNIGVGRLRMAENFGSNRIASLAAADVYFRRPARRDGRIELPSLFNPYWHARLAEPTTQQRLIAEAL